MCDACGVAGRVRRATIRCDLVRPTAAIHRIAMRRVQCCEFVTAGNKLQPVETASTFAGAISGTARNS
jgi:hypothetical protein